MQTKNSFNLTGHTHILPFGFRKQHIFRFSLVSWQILIQNDCLMFFCYFICIANFVIPNIRKQSGYTHPIVNCMKTFTEMFAKSQLVSTLFTPTAYVVWVSSDVWHIIKRKSIEISLKKTMNVWNHSLDMTWQSIQNPLKSCVRSIDFYAWLQTLSQSNFDIYMHWWSILVIEL